MEKDPVCGMMVDPSRAKATHEHAGKTYYFCCAGCKEKFSAAPAKYLLPKTLVGIAPMSTHPVQISPASADGAMQTAVKIAAVPNATRKADLKRIHMPNGSGSSPAGPRRLPEVRNGSGTTRRDASCDEDGIYLSHASGNRSGCARFVPDLWNGAGAKNGKLWRRRKIRSLSR